MGPSYYHPLSPNIFVFPPMFWTSLRQCPLDCCVAEFLSAQLFKQGHYCMKYISKLAIYCRPKEEASCSEKLILLFIPKLVRKVILRDYF